MEADYAFLAMGFLHPTDLTLDGFGVAKDKRGNAAATYELDTGFRTSVDKVFAAGDMRRDSPWSSGPSAREGAAHARLTAT